jgi:hypothetical protein
MSETSGRKTSGDIAQRENDDTDLEQFFSFHTAEHLDIDASGLTPELLEQFEHELEMDLRPPVGSIPAYLGFLTPREIKERRDRVEASLAEDTRL